MDAVVKAEAKAVEMEEAMMAKEPRTNKQEAVSIVVASIMERAKEKLRTMLRHDVTP